MSTFIPIFIGALLGLALVGYLADKRAATGDKNVTPGLKLLPGDIEWQNQSGNVRVFFPITSSIVLSIVLSLVMWIFR